MKKFIVCTSINYPTEAIEKFDSLPDWKLIVVGDLKTPTDFSLKNGIYMSPRDQIKMDEDLSDLIGWNSIQRRNFGLAYAFKNDGDLIASVDDDNIPLGGWGSEILINRSLKIKEFQANDDAFDPIGATEYKGIWHRGFPLELIKDRSYDDHTIKEITPSIQANFWNGDPDIDAFCRLEHKPECDFSPESFPFTSNKISPFNSQNTILAREVLLEYFLFPHVGRMDDIWASYYVQAKGHRVVYDKATVYQKRNEHNLLEDLRKEYLGYENNLKLINSLYDSPGNINDYLPERTLKAWSAYRKLLEK